MPKREMDFSVLVVTLMLVLTGIVVVFSASSYTVSYTHLDVYKRQPYLIGMTLSEATAALEEKGLTIGAQGASGKVTWQFPKADTEVEKGSQIRVELKE